MNDDLGAYIGPGYIKGKGPVDVYASTRSTGWVHALTKRDEWLFINRKRVVFTKRKGSN